MKTYHGLDPGTVNDPRLRHKLSIVDQALSDLYKTLAPLTKNKTTVSGQTTTPIGNAIKHSVLNSLAQLPTGAYSDDHPQYLNLFGRNGDQTLIGINPDYPVFIIREAAGQTADIFRVGSLTVLYDGSVALDTTTTAADLRASSLTVLGFSGNGTFDTSGLTGARTYTLQDVDGTLALVGDAPWAHAASHKSGGSDQINLDEFGATADNTLLNASTSAHGLLKKLDGSTSNFLRGDGSWATPPGSATVYNSGTSYHGRTTSLGQTSVWTPASDGFYRISWYVVCDAVTTPGVHTGQVWYTDTATAQGPVTIGTITLSAIGDHSATANSIVVYATTGGTIDIANTKGIFVGTYSVTFSVEKL